MLFDNIVIDLDCEFYFSKGNDGDKEFPFMVVKLYDTDELIAEADLRRGGQLSSDGYYDFYCFLDLIDGELSVDCIRAEITDDNAPDNYGTIAIWLTNHENVNLASHLDKQMKERCGESAIEMLRREMA